MNPENPKARFQKTDAAKWFADVSVNPQFVSALDFAILQMASELRGEEQALALPRHFMLEGAHRLRGILLSLSDPPKTNKPQPRDSLPYPHA